MPDPDSTERTSRTAPEQSTNTARGKRTWWRRKWTTGSTSSSRPRVAFGATPSLARASGRARRRTHQAQDELRDTFPCFRRHPPREQQVDGHGHVLLEVTLEVGQFVHLTATRHDAGRRELVRQAVMVDMSVTHHYQVNVTGSQTKQTESAEKVLARGRVGGPRVEQPTRSPRNT